MPPGLQGAETNPPPKAEEKLKTVGDEWSVRAGQAREGGEAASRSPRTPPQGHLGRLPEPEPGSRGAGPRKSRARPCCAAAPLRGPGALPGSQAPPGAGPAGDPRAPGAAAAGPERTGRRDRARPGGGRTAPPERAPPRSSAQPPRPALSESLSPPARPRREAGGTRGPAPGEQYLQGRGQSAAPPAPAAASASSRAPQAPPPRGRDFRGTRLFVGGAVRSPRPPVGGVTRRSAPTPGCGCSESPPTPANAVITCTTEASRGGVDEFIDPFIQSFLPFYHFFPSP
ncbi:unnamed protein product [Nyctereutes procyonoides]|uniref:(raccoon dog) hypothetical protein n=1 Tax=Nyctereutes procyonoides TaxID=34880 RepID=A0A811ZXC6_NYCPR|nr:unnamed protein product [Nyctereutes procyonoides]